MALVENKIGSESFISLAGAPDALKEDLELVPRLGFDGLAAWRTGRRCRPFQLRSAVDCASKAAARSKFLAYRDMIGADPVQLVWSDQQITAEDGTLVLVLDVRQLDCRTLLGSSGGLNPPSLGWLECEWDLVLVKA